MSDELFNFGEFLRAIGSYPWWQVAIELLIIGAVVYWVVMFPGRFGVGLAWMMGILLDVLNGSLLGEHALAMTLAIFVILRIRTRFRFFPIIQQGLGIFGMVLVYQTVIFCIQGFLGHPPADSWYWLAPFTSMLLWPWVFSMLHYCQCRFVK